MRRREKDIKTSVVGVHHGGEVLRISLSGPPIHFPIESVDQTGYRQPLSFDKRDGGKRKGKTGCNVEMM